MTALANRLNSKIESMNMPRADVIAKMATAADITPETVNEILAGSIRCPPLTRLRGFANALSISIDSLVSAAKTDGCIYPS